MTLIPASHSRFGWFRSGLLGGAGRGGPLRLVGIVSAIALGVGLAIFASIHNNRFMPQSQVAKMKPGNLLPGGLEGTPAQDALLKTNSQEKAHKAEEKHEFLYAAHAELQSVQRPTADRGRGGRIPGVRAGDRQGRDASPAGDRARTGAGLYAA